MGLNEKIASSVSRITNYELQPYKAVTDTSAYGNRFISPIMAAPAVDDIIHTTGAALSRPRNMSKVTNGTPKGQQIRLGSGATRGNNAPNRR
jgi:hypothetical protein